MSCSKGMSKVAEEDEQKLRECMVCKGKALWRRMKAILQDMTDPIAAKRAGTAAEKEDVLSGRQYGRYVYKCVECVAKEEECSITDAARKIKQPRRERDLERAREYAIAKNQVLEVWKFLAVDLHDDDGSVVAPTENSEDGYSVASTDSVQPQSHQDGSSSGDPSVSTESVRPSGFPPARATGLSLTRSPGPRRSPTASSIKK